MKHALIANALFSGGSGIALLACSASIAALFQAGPPLLYGCIGAGLIGFSLILFYETRRTRRPVLRLIIAMDALWVGASIALLLADPFSISDAGRLLIGIVALIVLLFACWQAFALVRMPRV